MFDEVDGQVETALLEGNRLFRERGRGHHFLGFDDPFRHTDDFVGAVQLNVAVDEQGRKFVHPVARNLYEFAVTNDIHEAPWTVLDFATY